MKNNYLKINGISLIMVQSTKKRSFHASFNTNYLLIQLDHKRNHSSFIQHKMPPYPEGFLNHLTADDVLI